jgi:hypothetical protein
MAIAATFTADFRSFSDAVQKAEVSLKSLESGAAGAETKLQRMANSLSGTKIIQDATVMAEAVERVGGVSKLTEKELARVAATAQEAAAKMRAMGVEVPPGIQKIADHAKSATGSFSDMRGVVTSLAGAFGVAFSIGAVVRFTQEIFKSADALQKMADQAGILTTQVQQLQFIESQTGTSTQALIGAIQNLQQRLGDDSTGAAGAMKKLNINMAEFNALDTFQQMTMLASAIQQIRNPTEQASVAAALFGKTWKEIMPAIRGDMQALTEQAPVMSAETTAALDRMGDAAGRFMIVMKGAIAETVAFSAAPFVAAFDLMAAAIGNVGTAAQVASPFIADLAPPGLPEDLAAINRELDAELLAVRGVQREMDAYTNSVERLTSAHENHIATIGDRLFGGEAIAKARAYAEAIGSVANASNLAKDAQAEVIRVMESGISALEQAGLGSEALAVKLRAIKAAAEEMQPATERAFSATEKAALAAAAAAAKVAAEIARITKETSRLQQELDAARAAREKANNQQIQFDRYRQLSDGSWEEFVPGRGWVRLQGRPPGRASGGPVSGGDPYIVGERGPELFIPNNSGRIQPNLYGGGSPLHGMSVMHNTFNVNGTAQDVARQISETIMRTLKQSRQFGAA